MAQLVKPTASCSTSGAAVRRRLRPGGQSLRLPRQMTQRPQNAPRRSGRRGAGVPRPGQVPICEAGGLDAGASAALEILDLRQICGNLSS